MGRRTILLALAVCMLVSLSGCSGQYPREAGQTASLPPAPVRYEAPDADMPTGTEKLYALYLPGKNGLNLAVQHVLMEPATLYDTVETLVSELLSYESNDQVDGLGGGTWLTLFGNHPVELSGGVCTVNLGSSALQLSYRQYYTVCLALAATLCELESIDSVNVLVADQSVGLDVAGGLAMGSLTAHPGENLPVLWEQMEARRTPLGSDMSQTPLNSLATLYFPLENAEGVLCETRTINFDGQTPQQMAAGILRELSNGSLRLSGIPVMPDLASLMLHEPLASELADGGRLITLSFREDAPEMLEARGIDLSCLVAAVTLSMTTFIPGTAAVSVRIGEQPVTQLVSERTGALSMLGGLLRRSTAEQFLRGMTTVYFEKDGLLVACEKAVDRVDADSPRVQLAALMAGPNAQEIEEGIRATLPEEAGEEDILGITAEGDTMLVNLSESFRAEIQSMGKEREMLLCYSMVNTLCENTGLRRVCFFFEGEQVEYIAGTIYWAGEFDWNSGLIEPSFG